MIGGSASTSDITSIDLTSPPDSGPGVQADHAADMKASLVVRLASLGVVLLAGVLAVLVKNGHAIGLMLAPVVVAALVMLVQKATLTARINGLERWFGERLTSARASKTRLGKFAGVPFLSICARAWQITSGIGEENLRAGVRLMAGLYVVAFFAVGLVLLAYLAVAIAIVVLLMVAAFWALGQMLGGGSKPGRRSGALAGSKIVTEGLFGNTVQGRIDANGRVRDTGLFSDPATGYRLATDGQIVKEDLGGAREVGRIDKDGRILESCPLGDHPTGMRIDEDGRLVEEGIFGDNPTGVRIERE